MSKVWAIFSDSTASEIKLNKMSADMTKELSLHPVSINNPQVKNSAKKAMNAAFDALKFNNRLTDSNYSFTFEFKGLAQVIEASASLAFALALVTKLNQFPFSIAATGVIIESSRIAKIQKIDFIENKLDAAIKELAKGDIVFIPEKNFCEVSKSTQNQYKSKGIKIQPVSTVEDAVQKIFLFNGENEIFVKQKIANQVKKRSIMRGGLGIFIFAICLILIKPLIFQNQRLNNSTKTELLPIKDSMATKILPENEPINITKNNKTDLQNRIKIELTGDHKKIVTNIKERIAILFQNNGFVINNESYDGIVTGHVHISDRQETPLRPYAPAHAIIVSFNIVVKRLHFNSNNGDQIRMGTISDIIETTKDNEMSIDSSLNDLFNNIDIHLFCKKIRFLLAEKDNFN